jgi:hypothetical protein
MPGNCRMHIAKNGRSDFYHATVAVQSRNSTRNGVCYIFERDIWNSKSSQPISHSNDLWKLNRFYTHHFWQIIHFWNWMASILYLCFLCPFFPPTIYASSSYLNLSFSAFSDSIFQLFPTLFALFSFSSWEIKNTTSSVLSSLNFYFGLWYNGGECIEHSSLNLQELLRVWVWHASNHGMCTQSECALANNYHLVYPIVLCNSKLFVILRRGKGFSIKDNTIGLC